MPQNSFKFTIITDSTLIFATDFHVFQILQTVPSHSSDGTKTIDQHGNMKNFLNNTSTLC